MASDLVLILLLVLVAILEVILVVGWVEAELQLLGDHSQFDLPAGVQHSILLELE